MARETCPICDDSVDFRDGNICPNCNGDKRNAVADDEQPGSVDLAGLLGALGAAPAAPVAPAPADPAAANEEEEEENEEDNAPVPPRVAARSARPGVAPAPVVPIVAPPAPAAPAAPAAAPAPAPAAAPPTGGGGGGRRGAGAPAAAAGAAAPVAPVAPVAPAVPAKPAVTVTIGVTEVEIADDKHWCVFVSGRVRNSTEVGLTLLLDGNMVEEFDALMFRQHEVLLPRGYGHEHQISVRHEPSGKEVCHAVTTKTVGWWRIDGHVGDFLGRLTKAEPENPKGGK